MESSTKKFIGMSLTEAQDRYSNVRIVSMDGESYAVTMDWDETRINIEVENGIIINAYLG